MRDFQIYKSLCLHTSKSGLVPGVGGRGKLKITSCCSCEVRHFSVNMMVPDREEKTTYFQGKSLEFGADWLEKNNLSKLKSVFEGTLLLQIVNECAFDAYSNGWRS